MNYLAGFLVITIADAVIAERDTPETPPSRRGSIGTATLGSPSSAAAATLSLELQAAAKDSVMTRGGGGGAGEPTARELEVIESESVEVMLGMIALQGGVLSRDLWGLHAVSETAFVVR